MITSDEKYIILYAQCDVNYVLNGEMFYVLDITDDNQYKLKKSLIKPPKTGRCNILLRGGGIEHEMLVIAWIKQLFKEKEFTHLPLPPMHLMKLICSWYVQKEIHWIGCGNKDNEHFAINTRHILSDLL